ncbi:transposon Tf2-1 polyprotein [Striga asiatica]|uniref:Transposon Tf2-1 polyprotein n=1 Tax=Striga asiatica TaxID=4170 RepID=A0A5A7QS21_STRAF|nr:transposon Tf2-1 polyprotein [Striga asiatica]
MRPAGSPWISRFLYEFHDSPMGSHSGFLRTYKRVAANLFWKGVKRMIRDYVAHEVCQRAKYEARSPAGLLQPLPIPDKVWDDVSMDFIGGLPKDKGCDTILVVVDRLSKYDHFFLLTHPYTAKQVAELFVREVVRLHGFPRSIVSDRDPRL